MKKRASIKLSAAAKQSPVAKIVKKNVAATKKEVATASAKIMKKYKTAIKKLAAR